MYRTIILDLDGPILEGRNRHFQCYADIVAELGGIPLPPKEYWALKRSRANRRDLLSRSGLSAKYDQFARAWLEQIEQSKYLQLDRLQPGVVEVLSSWRSEGLRLLLATMRQNEANLLTQLRELQIFQFFGQVVAVGIAQAGQNKATEVRRHLPSLSPAETLWVGDTEIDSEAARDLGVPVALLGCGIREPEWLKTLSPKYLQPDLLSLHRLLATLPPVFPIPLRAPSAG